MIIRASEDERDDSGDPDDDDSTRSSPTQMVVAQPPIVLHANGHMADDHFSEKELIWIEKNYGNSASFLMSHGLKFYDGDDCEEGKHIVKAMMNIWRKIFN